MRSARVRDYLLFHPYFRYALKILIGGSSVSLSYSPDFTALDWWICLTASQPYRMDKQETDDKELLGFRAEAEALLKIEKNNP